MLRRPFIYIAGLMRTGTTLIQEMLTQYPWSFIFHEPWLGSGYFFNVKLVSRQLRVWGIDFELLLNDVLKTSEPAVILFDVLGKYIPQLGVKEIRNQGWENYMNLFDDVRYIITGRDPRDIYISCAYRLKRDNAWTPRYLPFGPRNLWNEIEPDFIRQMVMWCRKDLKCLKVKYEDLCMEPDKWDRKIKRFVRSPIPRSKRPTEIGSFHGIIERGDYEVELHHRKITEKSVSRWKNEQDGKILENSFLFFNIINAETDYCRFWGYKESE